MTAQQNVPLAPEAGNPESRNVEDFSEHPMLYIPAVADEWMNQFWLGDVRPRREARLACLAERPLQTA